MLESDHRDPAVADELLLRSEAYLQDRGSKIIYGGGIRPLNAYYLGLYGGSELPGILATDVVFLEPAAATAIAKSIKCRLQRDFRSSSVNRSGNNGD